MTLLELFQGVMSFFDIVLQSEFVAGALTLFVLCLCLRLFWLLCVGAHLRDKR